MAEMSQRQYAKHRGVELSTVEKAIAAGRITKAGRGKIDPAKADAEWERNTIPRSSAARSRGTSDTLSFAKERAVHEKYKAAKAKLSYEQSRGKLLSREQVSLAEFNRSRIIRDGILNIPDRVAAQLAAETDARKVHEILTVELRNALNGIAEQFEAVAG